MKPSVFSFRRQMVSVMTQYGQYDIFERAMDEVSRGLFYNINDNLICTVFSS